MKKIAGFSILYSLSSVLIIFFFTLTSWSSANSNILTDFSAGIVEEVVVAPAVDINTLPLDVPTEAIIPMEQLQDAELQQALEGILGSDKRWVELSKNKTLSIGIVDMEDPMHSRFAAINPNNMVYAASLPKIAILLAS